MTISKSSGKAAGSSGRPRSAKPGFAEEQDNELPAEAERSEFHVEKPAFVGETDDRTARPADVAAEAGLGGTGTGTGSMDRESPSMGTSPRIGEGGTGHTGDQAGSMSTESSSMRMGESTGSLRDDMKQAAKSATRAVKQQASELASDLGSELGRTVEDQKRRGTEAMMGFARAIDTAAGEMESQSPMVARYVRDAARQVEGLSDTLNNRSLTDLMRSASDMARSRPLIFFGGAVAAGILLSRFLKSSAHHGHYDGGPRHEGEMERYADRPGYGGEMRPQGSDMAMPG